MHILHINLGYWPAHSGSEIHLGELSIRLAAAGHQVTVATTDAGELRRVWDPTGRRVVAAQESAQGVQIRRFALRHLPLSRLTYPTLRRLLWLLSAAQVVPVSLLIRAARFTPWVPDLARWLVATPEPFDLVAVFNVCFEPLLEAGLRFARRRRIPLITYPLTHLGAGRRPGGDFNSRLYTMRHQVALVRASDRALVQTPTEGDFYRSRGMSADRVVVVGPGVDPQQLVGGDGARFRALHAIDSPLVVSLGALAYDKGSHHLVEAVGRLRSQGRRVELALAGAVTGGFERFWGRLAPADRQGIHLLGFVSEAEKRDMLAAADIFAMPSRTDSFGLVYLEAWLYGLPVVGARAWGMADVIEDGQDGLLAPFGDVEEVVRLLGRLLDDAQLRQAMGQRGADKVLRQHTWARKCAMVQQEYGQIVAESSAKRIRL